MDNLDRNKYIFSNAPSFIDVSEEVQIKRKEQISLILKEMFLYKVLLKDLIAHKPSEKDKNLLLNISFYIVNDPELLSLFQSKRELPYVALCKGFKLPKVFFERWQDYIITYSIILANPNYRYIQDYLRIETIDEGKEIAVIKEKNHIVKGIIFKKSKFSSILLSSSGDFIKSKTIEGSAVGEEIDTTERITFRVIKYKLLIVLVLFLFIGIGMYKDYNTPIRTVIIETTSKVKLETNRYDNVIYSYTSTEKGKELLKDANSRDIDLDSVLYRCIKYAKENKMIPEGGLVITVTGETIKYGKLELTGEYIYDNNIRVLINNSGNQHKLYEIMKEKLEEKDKE